MTDAQSVDVGERPEHLVRIKLDQELRHSLLHFDVVSHDSVDCLWDIVHDDIEVDFVLLLFVSEIRKFLLCHLLYKRHVS